MHMVVPQVLFAPETGDSEEFAISCRTSHDTEHMALEP